MILNRFTFLFLTFLLVINGANAQEYRLKPKAVIELFTSQGCASCPAADKNLVELSKNNNIIALAYHVNYWDYIGWHDTFGNEENSKLQREYSKANNKSPIYTPQMIINGTKDVVGSHKKEIVQALLKSSLYLPVNIKVKDDYLIISVKGNKSQKEATIWLVTFISRGEVKISKGENKDKKLIYSNIVTSRHALGMWNPNVGAHIKLPLSKVLNGKNDGLAILVQNNKNGLPSKIIGSASYIKE